jgi:DNA-binding HxlR family transcriptional regulator
MNDIDRLRIAATMPRLKILETLLKGESSVYGLSPKAADQKTRGAERKVLAFHLKTLEDAGLVESRLVLENPVSKRYYRITTKGNQIYGHIKSLKQ